MSILSLITTRQTAPHGPVREIKNHLRQRFITEAPNWSVYRNIYQCNSGQDDKVRASYSYLKNYLHSPVQWHPHYPYTLAFTCECKDSGNPQAHPPAGFHISLCNLSDLKASSPKVCLEKLKLYPGNRRMKVDFKFHPECPSWLYTMQWDRVLCLNDIETGQELFRVRPTIESGNLPPVFDIGPSSAFDISQECNVVCFMTYDGSNRSLRLLDAREGRYVLKRDNMSSDGHMTWLKNLEFCPADNWLLKSVSLHVNPDILYNWNNVQHPGKSFIWDIRMLTDHNGGSTHDKGGVTKPVAEVGSGSVQSAYFHPVCGSKILVTEYGGNVVVYDSHDNWREAVTRVEYFGGESKPYSRERSLQDIGSHDAIWHPLHDNVCLVGNFSSDSRSYDFYRPVIEVVDLEIGERVSHIDTVVNTSLDHVRFNRFGDRLACFTGIPHFDSHVFVWRDCEGVTVEVQDEIEREVPVQGAFEFEDLDVMDLV